MTRETISLAGYMAISPTYASPGCMAKTAGDLMAVTEVMLEASSAKVKTKLPCPTELAKGWKGMKLGFASHDYSPIPTSFTGLQDSEVLELVCYRDSETTRHLDC